MVPPSKRRRYNGNDLSNSMKAIVSQIRERPVITGDTTSSSLIIPNLPGDMVITICCYLDLGSVQNAIKAFAGNIELATGLRNRYLSNNFYYLHQTNCMAVWEKKRENTIAWMQCNEWKAIFYCAERDVIVNNTKGDSYDKGKENQGRPSFKNVGCKNIDFDNQGPCKPFLGIIGSVERGIVEVTKHLIEVEGFDVNKQVIVDTSHFEMNINPLNIALKLPTTEMLFYLLQVENIHVNCAFQSTFGNTTLHYAAGDDGVTPTHMAALLSHPCILVDSRDVIGKTPLHYLCWFLPKDCKEKLRLLIRAGADINATCNNGLDPLTVLSQAGKHRRKNVDAMENMLRSALTTTNIIEPSLETAVA